MDNSACQRDTGKSPDEIAWIVRTLWGVILVGFTMGAFLTSLSGDVSAHSTALKSTVTKTELKPVVDSLERIESQLAKQDERQRTMQESLTRLETKVDSE